MQTNDNCSGCSQKKTCRGVYEQLGKTPDPSIAWKAVLAFLLPIVVFILSLAGADEFLEKRLDGRFLTLACFFTAFFITLVFVVIVRVIRGPNKQR